jgi:hypothetical protein
VGDLDAGRCGTTISARHHPIHTRQIPDVGQIIQIHVHHRRIAALEDFARGRGNGKLQRIGDLSQRLAVQFLPLIDEADFFGAAADVHHFHRLAVESPNGFRILESLQHGCVTASRGPVGNGVRAQIALRRRVWMLRSHHVDAARARLFDQTRRFGRSAEICVSLWPDVTEDHWRAGALSNRDRLLHRFEVANARVRCPEVAIVRVVDAAERGRNAIELDHFIGRGVGAGRVEESRRQADRSFLHPPTNEARHRGHLWRGRRPRLRAHNRAASRSVADVAQRIDADARATVPVVCRVDGALAAAIDA